jgi:hypothetical protein
MSDAMWAVVAVLGYVACGLIAARGVFEYYCRFHTPSYYRLPEYSRWGEDRGQVKAEMFLAFGLWPLGLTILTAMGLYDGTMKVLTCQPPKPASKTERLQILEEKNNELEVKTGIARKQKQISPSSDEIWERSYEEYRRQYYDVTRLRR